MVKKKPLKMEVKKTKRIHFRVTNFEKLKIEKKAKKAGLTLSDYCRKTALDRKLDYRLSDEELEMFQMLVKYKSNFSRLSNLIREKDPTTNALILETAKEIGIQLKKFK